MELIKCGEIVKINNTEIKATVIQICISFEKIEYQLAYMLNGVYTTIWMPLCMFAINENTKKQSIGFK
jgi:hypothetical protein